MRNTGMATALAVAMLALTLTATSASAAQFESTVGKEGFTAKGSLQLLTFGKAIVECAGVDGEGTAVFPTMELKSSVKYSTKCAGNLTKEAITTLKCESFTFAVEKAAQSKLAETAGLVTSGACVIAAGTCTIIIPSQKHGGIIYTSVEEDILIATGLKEIAYESKECLGLEAKGKNGEYKGKVTVVAKTEAELQVGPVPNFVSAGASYPIEANSVAAAHKLNFKNSLNGSLELATCENTKYEFKLLEVRPFLYARPKFYGLDTCKEGGFERLKAEPDPFCSFSFAGLTLVNANKYVGVFNIWTRSTCGGVLFKNVFKECERRWLPQIKQTVKLENWPAAAPTEIKIKINLTNMEDEVLNNKCAVPVGKYLLDEFEGETVVPGIKIM